MTKMEKTRRGVTPAVETVTKAPRRANTMHLSHAGQATVTTRQYARRAVLYALLFTLGGLFLFLYLIKGEGSVVFLLPTVVVVVFLVFLACGFKMSYASLRPRVNKTTAKKVAALSVAAESAQEALSPVAVPAPPVSVPDKAARALAKLFRHYGGNLQGVPDDILVHYAKDMLSGEPTPAPKSPALAHFAPVLQTISTVFKLLSPPLKTSVDLISFENFQEFSNTYQINLVQLFSDKMKNDFEVPLIESYFRLFPLQSQFFYPHIYAALIRGMGINRTDINFKQKIPFSINILEPFGSLKKDFIEGFEQEFVQKSLEDYCETKIMDLLKANLENKKIKSTDPKTFLSLFNIPLTNQNLTLDYKIGPDLTVDKLLKAYTEVLKNKNNVENLLTEIDPGIFGTKKDAKNIAKRLKILART